MKDIRVTLVRQQTTRQGKQYSYWVIRWYGSDGKRHGKTLGRTDELSRRQAEKLRQKKELELQSNPGRRDVSRSPDLGEFVSRYLADRKVELAAGTYELHERTGRYLVAHFGDRRRLEAITRADARGFKTALSGESFAEQVKKKAMQSSEDSTGRPGKRKRKAPTGPNSLAIGTVDQHIRQARVIFQHALDLDLITVNPFDRLAQNSHAEPDWHYVDRGEFDRLMAAASPAWRLMLGLARWAGLRLEETIYLRRDKVDWERRRLEVVAWGGWKPKDHERRTIPIVPELFKLLLEAKGRAGDSTTVVPWDEVSPSNVWRDFQSLFRRAGVTPYKAPFHALRKSCITDWASHYAAHVVKEWAGHADIRTTLKHYLKVSESEYDRASGIAGSPGRVPPSEDDFARAATSDPIELTPAPQTVKPLPNPLDNEDRTKPSDRRSPHEDDEAPAPLPNTSPGLIDLSGLGVVSVSTGDLTQLDDLEPPNRPKSRAGEGIRTPDVQLGKLAFYH